MTGRKLTWIYVDVVCDPCHAGYVDLLQRARALGDGLIVGVIGDDDAAELGVRPIMTAAERVVMVEACRFVDRVIAGAPTICTLAHLDAIGADFAVHGDDIATGELARRYRDVIQAERLKIIPCDGDISPKTITDRIVERLRNGTLRTQM